MFHYSLLPLNSRPRMLIALFGAIALHLVLLDFEFDRKLVVVPTVSLPPSVSVFLGQRNMAEIPVVQSEKAPPLKYGVKEQQAAEREPEKPVMQKVSTTKEKRDIPLQQPAPLEKTVERPAAETTGPAAQRSEYNKKDLLPAPGKAAKAQESGTPAELSAAQENDGTTRPGTLQMAYPRYQLNSPPVYPALARKRGQEGTVVLQVLVSSEGRVDDLKIEDSSGFTLLDRAAETSVRKWSFEPGRRGEERIPMWVRVPVAFKLEQ